MDVLNSAVPRFPRDEDTVGAPFRPGARLCNFQLAVVDKEVEPSDAPLGCVSLPSVGDRCNWKNLREGR